MSALDVSLFVSARLSACETATRARLRSQDSLVRIPQIHPAPHSNTRRELYIAPSWSREVYGALLSGWVRGSDFKIPFVRTKYVDARAGEDTSGA